MRLICAYNTFMRYQFGKARNLAPLARNTMNTLTFSGLLSDALTKPGKISAAYSAFHSYSFGNMMAAAAQLEARGIPLGPIASFMAWKDKGRSVKKGAKAMALCMPVTGKGKKENEAGET